ncbi:LysR family transcriptional regulator [Paenibacillus sp. PSB04]|uniref:LysR family transcriptional regulator n=1 Tax=Paenibacillus sp. PSB04 TaxID=2866810 RepID=UPI0021F213B1|nr:LysR family transcriptional regulator [Paenibacillus sp. PSB04]UYO03997.1 LysR family transcriptional regulator [Paenibacillus sp. PSB04]
MNLHALRVFAEVASTGSVTRAAGKLLLSQPAATAQLRNLEQELGMKLVTSKGRSIQLTPAGERLAARARQLFSLEYEMEREMNALKIGLEGSLRICATDLPGRTVLPAWIVRFKQQYPKVHVQLTRGSSRIAMERLLDHSVDIALICGEGPKNSGLEYITLMEDELIFIAHPDHPLAGAATTLQELMAAAFILREEGSYTRRKLFSLCDAYEVPKPRTGICIEGMHETIEAVKSGYGVSFVPSLAVARELKSGELAEVRVPGMRVKDPIRLYTRIGEEPLAPAANFMAMIAPPLSQVGS